MAGLGAGQTGREPQHPQWVDAPGRRDAQREHTRRDDPLRENAVQRDEAPKRYETSGLAGAI